MASDLTEISDLAQQMRLRENLASLGEMSAGIAHEFKNSLATISGYAQMLRSEGDNETVNTFATKIADETSNLTRVVTDFLNFAKPQEDGSPKETLALRSLIEECARESALQIDLNECPFGLSIQGDATAWRQAFSNLLRNSAEAARDGQPVQVKVTATEQGEKLQIKLRDNGCGIPPEQLQKIFVPFFTTKSRGTGLGLALVHKIVAQHGGTISVASDSAGTEFTITVPARAGGAAAGA
jgi:signal transduction histidine kinase